MPDKLNSQIYKLLCCLLSDQTNAIAWEELAQEDWEVLEATARAERVAPLIYQKLGNSLLTLEQNDRVCQHIGVLRGKLAADYYTSAAYNQLLFNELGRVSAKLHGESIRAVLLKGAALAISVYPDIALRPMGDLDLLVSSQTLDVASNIIESLGYKKIIPEMQGFKPLDNRAFNHEVKLVGGPQDSVLVELHWNLVGGDADRRSPELDWFCQEIQSSELPNNEPVNIFSPTANLVYLCAHVMLQHGEYRSSLLWFYDLQLLIDKYKDSIEWDRLPEISARFHWADAVYLALVGVQMRFGTDLPGGIIDKIKAHSDPRTRRMVEINAEIEDERLANLLISREAYNLSARMRIGMTHIFPGAAYMRWRYKPKIAWLWFLYYPTRWWNVMMVGLTGMTRKR